MGIFGLLGVIKRKTIPLPTPTSDLWANAIVGFPTENLLKRRKETNLGTAGFDFSPYL